MSEEEEKKEQRLPKLAITALHWRTSSGRFLRAAAVRAGAGQVGQIRMLRMCHVTVKYE